MRILSIGGFSVYGESNTCLHRTWALERLAEVDRVDTAPYHNTFLFRVSHRLFTRYRLPIPYFAKNLNKLIIGKVQTCPYDIIWIDKGVLIQKSTLQAIKKISPKTLIVGYSPDNMVERHNQSQVFIDSFSEYDFFITTKSYTVGRLKEMGCPNIIFVNNAYEEAFHKPYKLSASERERLGGVIGFIGSWEQERCESILYLAKAGLPIRVWGGGKWLRYQGLYPNLKIEEKGLFSEDYNKSLSAFDISLCFLRKINHDQQTTRTMEIPACGSLLMAERTSEHEALFEEGKEAVFFSTNEELLEKCRYYITYEKERIQIADAGRQRAMRSGYSNYRTIENVLKLICTKSNE